ncbi:sensor histidine kinase, partial [Streptomyces alkaliphilus]
PYDGGMRRVESTVWEGLVGPVVCLAVGTPVLIGLARGTVSVTGPSWLWALLLLAFLTAMVLGTWRAEQLGPDAARWVLIAQVALGSILVLTAPDAGWTPILLVFTSAIAGYLVSLRGVAAIIAAHTVVVTLAVVLTGSSPAEAAMVALLYLLLQVGTVLGVTAHRRELEAHERLAVAHAELRATGALLEEAGRTDERLRIARELHDLLGHQLTVLTLELEVASHHATPPAEGHVRQARATARELLGDVRATVGELRRHAPDLRDALEGIVAKLPEPAVHLRVDEAVRTDEARTALLIRCFQEVVTNTIRHSGASRLWVDVTDDGQGGVVFTARDDGRAHGPVVAGNGLRGLTERVEELGGRTRFTAGRGFRVVAEVPGP